MLRNFRLLPTMTALVYSLILVGAGVAFAKGSHKHQAGLQLLGSKINTDGAGGIASGFVNVAGHLALRRFRTALLF
jgi:hypothetical protein